MFFIRPKRTEVTAVEVEAGDWIRVSGRDTALFHLCDNGIIQAIRLSSGSGRMDSSLSARESDMPAFASSLHNIMISLILLDIEVTVLRADSRLEALASGTSLTISWSNCLRLGFVALRHNMVSARKGQSNRSDNSPTRLTNYFN